MNSRTLAHRMAAWFCGNVSRNPPLTADLEAALNFAMASGWTPYKTVSPVDRIAGKADMDKSGVYNSTTHGRIPLSARMRGLMQGLRFAIQEAVRAGDYNKDDAVAHARGEIAKYVSELEDRNATQEKNYASLVKMYESVGATPETATGKEIARLLTELAVARGERDEYKVAWMGVMDALYKAAPGWNDGPGSPAVNAAAAIRRMREDIAIQTAERDRVTQELNAVCRVQGTARILPDKPEPTVSYSRGGCGGSGTPAPTAPAPSYPLTPEQFSALRHWVYAQRVGGSVGSYLDARKALTGE